MCRDAKRFFNSILCDIVINYMKTKNWGMEIREDGSWVLLLLVCLELWSFVYSENFRL